MESIQIFNNSEFGQIRTIEMNGNPWFVGKDITDALGYSNASKALADHVEREDKLNNESLSSLGQRGGWLVNESGLYSLILASKLPTAKKFKHWVTSEVLPAIRRSGRYEIPNLTPEVRAIFMLDERTQALDQKFTARMDKLEYDIPLYGAESDELSNHVKRKGVEMLGGKASEAYQDTRIRSQVYTDIYGQIKREFGLYEPDGRMKSYKALKRRYLAEAHEVVDAYELPAFLREKIEDANAQMSLDYEEVFNVV